MLIRHEGYAYISVYRWIISTTPELDTKQVYLCYDIISDMIVDLYLYVYYPLLGVRINLTI